MRQLNFNQVKGKLVSAPILGYPDFTKSLILESDASFKGLGTVTGMGSENEKTGIY